MGDGAVPADDEDCILKDDYMKQTCGTEDNYSYYNKGHFGGYLGKMCEREPVLDATRSTATAGYFFFNAVVRRHRIDGRDPSLIFLF